MHAPPDWYKTFFTGLAVEMWLNAMPAEETAREAEFLRAKLQVAAPAKLLDVPCGTLIVGSPQLSRYASPTAWMTARVSRLSLGISPQFSACVKRR